MPGRRWSEGLHQAIEAKEGVKVQRESVTLATITFQNYFRLYDKLAGMTGTAMTEAEEFHKIYELEVVAIPTHRDMIRDDDADLVFRNELGKFNALIDEVAEMQEAGRPVLVGTVSVEKSEILSTMLKRRGIRHETLNAKFHEKRVGDRRPGRADGRGHDRDEHGRPRHGHQARRRRGRPRVGPAPQAGPEPGRGRQGDLRRGPRRRRRPSPTRTTRRSSPPAGSTSSAPSATTAAGSTTSSAAGPAARATRAPRASTCPSRTT